VCLLSCHCARAVDERQIYRSPHDLVTQWQVKGSSGNLRAHAARLADAVDVGACYGDAEDSRAGVPITPGMLAQRRKAGSVFGDKNQERERGDEERERVFGVEHSRHRKSGELGERITGKREGKDESEAGQGGENRKAGFHGWWNIVPGISQRACQARRRNAGHWTLVE